MNRVEPAQMDSAICCRVKDRVGAMVWLSGMVEEEVKLYVGCVERYEDRFRSAARRVRGGAPRLLGHRRLGGLQG